MLIDSSVLAQLTKRAPTDITMIVIHHSVAPSTWDIEQIAQVESFLTVGYNAYCKKTPTGWVMQQGRPLDCVPAAQYGLNTEGYAICIGGNYQPGAASFTDTVDPEAIDAVLAQIHAVREHGCYNLKWLIGHRDVAKMYIKQGMSASDASYKYGTACPGDNLYEWMGNLRKMSGLSAPDWLS